MPSYDWVCEECGVKALVEAPIADRDIAPKVEGPCEHKWKRLMTTGGFVLKNGGWAKDGYDSGLKLISK